MEKLADGVSIWSERYDVCRPDPLFRYGTGAILGGLALLGQASFHPFVDSGQFLFLYPGVCFVAWFCGIGPALLATLIGTVGASLLLFAPDGRLSVLSLSDWYELTIFSLLGSTLSFLIGNQREVEARVRKLLIAKERELRTLTVTDKDTERFFALSIDPLCIANAKGYFVHVNPAFTQVLGYSEADLTTRPISEMVHPHDRVHTQGELESLARGIDTLYFENRYEHRDGHYVRIVWRARTDGATGRIYAVGRASV